MSIGRRKELLELMFRTLAFRQGEWRQANARNFSFRNFFKINYFDKTKLLCYIPLTTKYYSFFRNVIPSERQREGKPDG